MTKEYIEKELAEINTLSYQKAHTITEVWKKRAELYAELDKIAAAEEAERKARLTEEERKAEEIDKLEKALMHIRMAEHLTFEDYKTIEEIQKEIEKLK
jgi:hypothetical protein